jgi:anti-sigma factor RsiW
MNRRQFVSRVSLGAAAACTTFAKPSLAATGGRVNVRFVGMMAFVERADHSFLVATPGQHVHHMTHVPFLMAKAGTPLAKALGMVPAMGVVPAAFDTELIGTNPGDFVYRNLDNTAIEIITGTEDAVRNEASEMAQLQKIAPGKRVRGNIEKWAATTISLRGGRLENSSGHPDAHKMWSFGNYRQRLTDAVNFQNIGGARTTIRLTSGTDVRTFTVPAGDTADLWMISAATPDSMAGSPNKLVHSELLFEYLVDAKVVLAECPEATGRNVPPTELPYVQPTSASAGTIGVGTAFPPITDFCFVACILLGG